MYLILQVCYNDGECLTTRLYFVEFLLLEHRALNWLDTQGANKRRPVANFVDYITRLITDTSGSAPQPVATAAEV